MITGGSGLLGMSLTRRLVSLGMSVSSTYYTRPPPPNLKQYFYQYDFTKYEDCLASTRGQDYVIICAVQASGVKGVKESPTVTLLPNLEIHAGLLEACCENGIEKVVWVSSSSVYQEASYPISEDQLDLNQQPYELYQGIGWVYRYLEELAKCYNAKRGLKIGIIRTANIYGPYDRFDDEKSHVIPGLIKRALKKELSKLHSVQCILNGILLCLCLCLVLCLWPCLCLSPTKEILMQKASFPVWPQK